MPRRPLMVRAARCCDGAATELRRPAPSRSFCASRRADAAATELMLRAALLRRSCDGVAAATELRRPAPSRSFCASRLDATLNEEPASFPPGLIQISKVVAHSPNRPPPWPRNILPRLVDCSALCLLSTVAAPPLPRETLLKPLP